MAPMTASGILCPAVSYDLNKRMTRPASTNPHTLKLPGALFAVPRRVVARQPAGAASCETNFLGWRGSQGSGCSAPKFSRTRCFGGGVASLRRCWLRERAVAR